jgi:mxaJ protein
MMRSLSLLLAVLVVLADARAEATERRKGETTANAPRRLRVCADPNNLPFSNERSEGFENHIAELVAKEMGAELQYTWWAQRRGFFRNTLKAGLCDVVMGVPTTLEMVLPTRPYYRSGYAAVFGRRKAVRSLDDPALRSLRVGVQVVGDDGVNTPPVTALSRRGIIDNVFGYSVVGDYSQANPPAEVIEAVRRGEVDVAIAWGPLAGYFATHGAPRLRWALLSPSNEASAPLAFDISMGVRHRDRALRAELDRIIVRRHKEIIAILDRYGVPRLPLVLRPGRDDHTERIGRRREQHAPGGALGRAKP